MVGPPRSVYRGRGWTVGGRTRSERGAAAAARTRPSGTRRTAVKPAHVRSGGRIRTVGGWGAPASFVCRGVARVYRTGRGDGSSSTTEGPSAARRPSADGTRRRLRSGPHGGKRQQVQLEGGRARRQDDRGRRTAPASPARHGTGSPTSRLQTDSLFFEPACGCGLAALLTSGPACSLRGASRTLVTWLA